MKITKRNLRKLIRENLLKESMLRYAGIYLASDRKWYLDLASNEHGEHYDATTYGPFSSETAAESHLKDNFSNPGGLDVDDSGVQAPPTRSPNGEPVQSPRSGNYGGFGGYGGGGRRRW